MCKKVDVPFHVYETLLRLAEHRFPRLSIEPSGKSLDLRSCAVGYEYLGVDSIMYILTFNVQGHNSTKAVLLEVFNRNKGG